MDSEFIKSHNITYYNKYNSIFNKYIDEINNNSKKNIESLLKLTHVKNNIVKFPKWVITYKNILAYSKEFNIKYNMVINMGMSTNVKYNAIKQDQINPSVGFLEENYNLVYNKLLSYYTFVIKSYYLIKFSDTLKILPYEIFQILQKHPTKDINNKLPHIDTKILTMYKSYKDELKTTEIHNFLLDAITSIILQINEIFKKNNISKYQDLLKYINNYIIRCEEMYSIAPDIVIKKPKEEKQEENNINDSDSDTESEASVNSDFSQAESDLDIDEVQKDEFSLADFDLDDEVDNEDNAYKANDD